MNYNSLAELMEHPPVRTTKVTLSNDVICQIYELPISAIDRVRIISEDSDQVNMSDVVYVATWAIAGHKPTEKEVAGVSDRFGTSSVMEIYTEALRFSQLSKDAIEQEKKL